MRLSLAVAASVLLVCGIARADQITGNPTNANATVGIGMVCNTPEQAERYISLIGAGQKGELAMHAVNAEVKNPKACGVAAVMFTRGATLDTKTVHGKALEIVQISIIAGFDGVRWTRAAGQVQYAVMQPRGIEI